MLLEFPCRTGEQQPVEGFLPRSARCVECGVVGRTEFFDGARRRTTGECTGTQRFRPPTRGLTQFATEKTDDGVGDVVGTGVRGKVSGRDALPDEGESKVADDLRRRRHLDQTPQHRIGGSVGLFDGLEAVTEPQRDGLLTQIRQLAARDLVRVDAPGRCGNTGLEGGVHLSHRFPVRFQVADRLEVQPGVTFGVRKRRDDCRQWRLTRRAGQGCRRAVDGVCPRIDGREVRRQLPARGVVGVDVDRQIELASQRTNQLVGRRCTQQTRHVLDGQHMRACVDDLLRQAQVVVERVELLVGVREVARVAHRDLGDRAIRLEHGVDCGSHLFDVVERVEDSEDVDAHVRRLGDECRRHLLRVRRVAHGVGTAKQHLQTDVGDLLAQLRQPIPRIFLQEPQRDVVGGTAPTLDGQQLRGRRRDIRCDGEHSASSYARREQRLMGVAERRIGDTDRRAVTKVTRKTAGPQGQQSLPRAVGWGE